MSLYHVNIHTRDNGNGPEYDAVEIQDPDGHRHRWESDNPVLDWARAINFLHDRLAMASFGSSLSDFVIDVPGYRFIEDTEGIEWLMYDPTDLGEVKT